MKMINNLEVEYKILVNKDSFEKLSALYKDKMFVKQTNYYYDTETLNLRNQKCALRIREKNNTFLITLKTPASKGHHEYECYVKENSPEVFKTSEIKDILYQLIKDQPLIELGKCVTYRAVVALEKAELCFDINEYNGITDYEIEYEQTCDHDGITVFNQILSQVNLKYEKNCASKIKRTLKSK